MTYRLPRVVAYVDGFNLYYRALKREPRYRWLDLVTLSTDLLGSAYQLTGVRYFSAPISGKEDPGAEIRQDRYLQALRTFPQITIHLGSFLSVVKTRQLETALLDGTTHVKIRHQEEKGSDVNLASYLIHDAWSRCFDVALLFSQDTDLLEPVRLVKVEIGKPAGVVILDGREPGKLAQSGGFQRHITPSRLAAAQLPATIFFGRKGRTVSRPAEWV